jgi:L-cysteine:1D-myo-inositol 2-amino-2-deoxy-alpha-D-glucopyranoside ligase
LQPEQTSDFLIDIQGGGSDLIFPHHEMSAAQARVSTGRNFSRFYVHTGMIGLNGQKMSKSLGNLV